MGCSLLFPDIPQLSNQSLVVVRQLFILPLLRFNQPVAFPLHCVKSSIYLNSQADLQDHLPLVWPESHRIDATFRLQRL